jgi:hypothetical protein
MKDTINVTINNTIKDTNRNWKVLERVYLIVYLRVELMHPKPNKLSNSKNNACLLNLLNKNNASFTRPMYWSLFFK